MSKIILKQRRNYKVLKIKLIILWWAGHQDPGAGRTGYRDLDSSSVYKVNRR